MPSVGDAGDGRFVLKKLLGEGGAGRVWLAEDRERPGLDLALKELTGPETTRHEDAFRREFATLACLRHPSLVEVDEFDISPDTGRTRFTLELVEGRLMLRWTPHRHELTTAPEPEPIETELIHGVESVEFAYWGSPSPGQPAGWQAQWDNFDIPGLIRVRLAFAKDDRRRWPDLITAPRR